MSVTLELAVAALYLIGASFNATYTLRNSDSFYGSFAEAALLPPAKALIRKIVMPNGRAFTIALIAFQLAVAVLIIARGDLARLGLIAGAGFSLAVASASSAGGMVGNLALAALQAGLAATQ